jgi:hypothetical protein
MSPDTQARGPQAIAKFGELAVAARQETTQFRRRGTVMISQRRQCGHLSAKRRIVGPERSQRVVPRLEAPRAAAASEASDRCRCVRVVPIQRVAGDAGQVAEVGYRGPIR